MADQRKVEAGREKLAAYKKKKRDPTSPGKKSPKVSSPSPDNSMTSNDASSPSPSPNRHDEVQKLTTRVRHLEELLAGKTAAMQAMQERLDTSTDLSADLSTGMLSFSLESDYKTHLERYQQRLEEFSAAVAQRDELITELSARLSTIPAREAREKHLTEELAVLQRQLRATRDLVQGTSWDTGVDPQHVLDLQDKILEMEEEVKKNKAMIDNLNATIQQKDTALLEKDSAIREKNAEIREKESVLFTKSEELQQKVQELIAHKTQAASEVVQLMRAVEDLNQQQAVVPVAADDSLRLQLEEDFGMQLQRIKEELRLQSAAELKQCRQTQMKEMELARQQNETLELELDRLAGQQRDCLAELAACKEAYIAQWGLSSHPPDGQLAALRQRVSVLTEQLQSTAAGPPSSDVQAAMEGEVRSLHIAEVAALQETIAQLGRQAEEAAADNGALRQENVLFAAQMETYKEWLAQRTEMAERNGRDVFDLQKELSDYKNQLERLDNRHSTNFSAMQLKYDEQIKDLTEKLKNVAEKLLEKEKECDAINIQSAKNLATCQKYEEQMKELSDRLNDVGKQMLEKENEWELSNRESERRLSMCKKYEEQIEALSQMLKGIDEKVSDREKECELYKTELKECKENMKELDDSRSTELAVVRESFETEMKNLQNSHKTELEDLHVQIQELHAQLTKESTQIGSGGEGGDLSLLPTLRFKIRDLQNVVKHRDEAHGSVKTQLLDSMAKLHALQALLAGKEELEQSLIEKEQELTQFNQSFSSLEETKSSLEKRVQELEEQLRATKVTQSERNEVHNETELIANLRNRIEELEKSLNDLNSGSQALRVSLQETVVQCLSSEALCTSKDELISALNTRVTELEELLRDVNERAVSMNSESNKMMTQVAKAKELLKRSKVERDELIASCKRLEDDSGDLRKTLAATEAKLAASQLKVDNLDFVAIRLEQLEKDYEEMSGKCDGYEAEVTRLRELLASSETSLEGVQRELTNNRAPACLEVSLASRDCVVDRRQTLMMGAGDCPVAGMSFMGASFFNNSSNLHNMTEYMEVAGWSADGALTLVDNYARLDNVRHQLEADAEAMQAQLEETELAVTLGAEEAGVLKARCVELEAVVAGLRDELAAAEKDVADRGELETRVETLSKELHSLKAIQESLRAELCQKQVAYEEKVHEMLQGQLSQSRDGDDHSIEDLIYELGSRAKEVVVLREALRTKEQEEEVLDRRLQESEGKASRLLDRLAAAEDEVSRARTELDAAWAEQRRTAAESAAARKDLAVAAMANQHLNDSLARSRQMDSSISLDQVKTALVKLALLHESSMSTSLADAAFAEGPPSADGQASAETDSGLAELGDRLAGIFSRQAPGQSAAANEQAALMAELAFYREQNATLAEVLGSTGVLQEVLHRQKQQLLLKLEEKASVQRQLERERSRLSETELRLAMLEQTLAAKDAAFAELEAQKRRTEDDLRRIEEQLREKEDSLLTERHELEAQIHDRDLRIRHWQLQCRASQVSPPRGLVNPAPAPIPAPAASPALDRLDAVRRDLNVAHDAALARLKRHLRRVFSAQETELQARHDGQMALAQEQHRQQLTTIQQQLEENCKDLESKLTQIHDEKNDLDVDLEEMKIKLDGSQKEVFDVLQKKFKLFGQKQVTAAIERVKSEHERMVANLTVVHSQELIALQYKSEERNSAQLLLIKQELLNTYESDLKQVEQDHSAEIARLTEAPKLHPTDSKSALNLLKHFLCTEFSQSFQEVADARHGQYTEELSELSRQLEVAMQLEQPKDRQDALLLLDAEEDLIEQAQGTLERVVSVHATLAEALGGHVDAVNAQLLAFLELVAADVRPATDCAVLRANVATLRQDLQACQEQLRTRVSAAERARDDAIARLDRLLAAAGVECGTCAVARSELEARHRREVEELRTYFEQKCADVEKHYSEEVFSQHSRKLSTGSSSCENELAADLYFGPESRSPAGTGSHVCDPLDSLGYREAETQCRREYEARLGEYRAQLDGAKAALEDGYRAEMAALKRHYDDKLGQLAHDLAETHQASLVELQSKHVKELENVKTQLESDVEKVRAQLLTEHRRELELQVDAATEAVKLAAEQEQEKFMRVQKEIMSGFLLQHDQDVQLLTQKFEVRLRAANDEIRKLTQEHEEYADSIMQNKQRLHAEVQQDVLRSLDKYLEELLSNGGAAAVPSCPTELVQLLAKFHARYEQELAALRLELAAAVSQAADQSAPGARQSIELAAQESKADFRQMARTMKELVCELAKYVTVCEDELNNTLVQQILRTADSADTADSEDVMRDAGEESLSVSNGNTIPFLSMMSNLDSSECDGSKTQSESLSNDMTYLSDNVSIGDGGGARSPRRKVRRVHFAPNISSIVNMDECSLARYVDSNGDLAGDIRTELDSCLRRLKAEAASILGRAASSQKAAVLDASAREELSSQLGELDLYRGECQRLAAELDESRRSVARLEAREDVTEGYGEQSHGVGTPLNMAELQDQARFILSESTSKTPQLRLIEELCREGDRLVDESKHEKDDLQQQVSLEPPPSIVHMVCSHKVAAADKQLRSTRRFLEEQAAEREQERDDFLAEIARLKDQMRAADQLKADRHDKEVETLETQVKEATTLLKDADAKRDELEIELKAAIDKVWVLRDIISDLESQVEVKARNEATLEEQVNEMRTLVEQQTQSNLELSTLLDSGHGEMSAHISDLEDQLRRHHQQMEQFQPDSMRQMKTTLREFETTLDKKTKDLESLYVGNNSNASSPCLSEDVSIRDQMESVRSATPDGAPVSLPLAQLLRLQDKMAAHSRAEQAALKQIRDLEMEIASLRKDRDEASAERDALQTQLGEQLLTISRLHANVDGQRQATDEQVALACADLHKRWQDTDALARELAAAAESKDKQIEASAALLAQTRAAVATQESDWKAALQREQDGANKLRAECDQLALKVRHLEENIQLLKQKRNETTSSEANSNQQILRKIPAVNGSGIGALEGQNQSPVQTEAAQKRIVALESDQRERQAVELELRLQLESRDLRVSDLEAQLESRDVRIAELQAQLHKLEKEARRLRHRLKASAAVQEKVPAAQTNNHELGQTAPAPVAATFENVLPENVAPNLPATMQKLLASGIESLTPDELCSLQETLRVAGVDIPLQGNAAHTAEATTEKMHLETVTLRSRVQLLCQELADKDSEAKQKHSALEELMAAERQQHEEARRDLESEQLRAADVAAQHERLQHETDSCAATANSLQLQLEAELSRVRALDAEMCRVKKLNKQLQVMLDTERQRAIQSNLQESDLMAAMRTKLEACLESEAQLCAKLAKMEKAETLRRHNQPARGHGASSHKELQEAVEREKVEAAGLELALKQQQRRTSQLESLIDKEKQQATQRLQAERDKCKKMRKQLQAVEEDKENLNTQLEGARETLAAQQAACADLSRRLADEAESAQARQARWQAEEQRLRDALAAARADHAALEDRAAELQARGRLDGPDGAAVSPPMLQKLKAANALLEKHVAENVEVSLAMSRLTEDRQRLQERVRRLEADAATDGRQRSADKEMEVVNELLAAERTTWSREKAALLNALAQAEAAKRQRDHSEDADKMRHMFGKYLRVESYRKALAWQKRYLLIVISGYQSASARAAPPTQTLTQGGTVAQRADAAAVTRPCARFRSVGVAIIAVHRMQFLVRRWKNGRGAGPSTVFIHGSTESLASATSSYLGARQRQGSTVSAWSLSRGISSAPDSSRGGLEPLQVAEYINRFDQLQQRLGLVVSPSTPMAS